MRRESSGEVNPTWRSGDDGATLGTAPLRTFPRRAVGRSTASTAVGGELAVVSEPGVGTEFLPTLTMETAAAV